jgi:tyrosyl-tRNA synthetase
MSGGTTFLDELRQRAMLQEATPGIEELFAAGAPPVTAYVGFDPTADSLHAGSLLPIMALVHLQRAGHRPIALVGGGTGMIGDPSGKAQERSLLDAARVEANLAGIRGQLERFLDFAGPRGALLLNNAEWLSPARFIPFLRDVGKHFTVNYMLQKESVSRRLREGEGISFTEFSYMLLQAWDFVQLNERHACALQMGGSDQWGNITAGIELVRRMRGAKVHGLVVPLVTTETGSKFGKTEAGTIWLDAARTSPFRFYQFWINTADDDVARYLGYFTLLGAEERAAAARELAADPASRAAQRLLAREVTRLVHGAGALARAERASEVFFGAEFGDLGAAELLDVFADVPAALLPGTAVAGGGMALVDVLAVAGVAKSKSEARRLIEGGGVYVNNRRASDAAAAVGAGDFVEGKVLVLRKGKKDYHLVKLGR